MHGLQLIGDLIDCRCIPERLTDAELLRAFCLGAVERAGLTPVGHLFHRFAEGAGVTGVVLLAESHLAVHTWPEQRGATLDIYVCNFSGDNSDKARMLERDLIAFFAPGDARSRAIPRGTGA